MDADAMDRLVTNLESRFGSSWRDIVEWMQAQHSVGDLEQAIATGNFTGVDQTIQDAATKFAADVQAGYAVAGQRQAKWLDAQTDSIVRFDQQNAGAVAWAKTNQYDKIVQTTQQQRAMIGQVVNDGIAAGRNPRDVARDLRDSLGLTDEQTKIVDNYRRRLESGDASQLGIALQQQLSDGRYDSALRTAIANGVPVPPDRIDKMVDAYRSNFVDLRAETIARTEGLRAAHEGSEEALRQAIANGDVEASALTRVWNTAGDGRVRESHRIDGQERAAGDDFELLDGSTLAYPGDPDADPADVINCRCVVSTKFSGAPRTDAAVDAPAEAEPDAPAPMEGASADDEPHDIIERTTIDPSPYIVTPWNPVTSQRQADEIADNMRDHGWQGDPLVVVETGNDKYRALTGSHRLAAAQAAGIQVPVVVAELPDGWKANWEGVYRDGRLMSDAYGVEEALEKDGASPELLDLIRENPTEDQIADRKRREQANSKPTDRTSSAPTSDVPAVGTPDIPAPPKNYGQRIVDGYSVNDDGSDPALDRRTQSMIRGYQERVLGAYGVETDVAAADDRIALVEQPAGLANAMAVRWPTDSPTTPGLVEMRPDVAQDYGDLAAKLDAGTDTDIGAAWRAATSRPSLALAPVVDGARSDAQALADQVKAYQVVTHEQLHGAGPSYMYRDHGVWTEEMATELTARRVTRDVLGFELGDWPAIGYGNLGVDAGSYNNFVDQGTASVRAVFPGLDAPATYSLLEDAAVRYKQQTSTWQLTPDDALKLYVQQVDVDAATGKALTNADRTTYRDRLFSDLKARIV